MAGRQRRPVDNAQREQTNVPPRSVQVPDLGSGQYFLRFRSSSRAGRLVAEPLIPVFDESGRRVHTILAVGISGRKYPFSRSTTGDVAPPAFTWGGGNHAYLQVTKPLAEPAVGPPYPPSRSPDDRPEPAPGELEHLRDCDSVPRLAVWAKSLLFRLVHEGRLSPAVGEAARRGPIPPERYEEVGRAFEQYLSLSGEFKYSLSLRRQDNQVDPIEDFVENTKAGHCTRFATALALMLRSVGIPTRIVLGYRGYETAGDGVYEVLQCHAHSWVEALIVRPVSRDRESPWRWLTLDPTPSGDGVADAEFTWGQWWEFTRQQAGGFFKNFIVEYDTDQQERTRYAMSKTNWMIPTAIRRLILGPSGDDWVRAGIVGIAGVAFLLAAASGRPSLAVCRSGSPRPTLKPRFTCAWSTFGGACIENGPEGWGNTTRVRRRRSDRLRSTPAGTYDVADVPAKVAAIFYRVRFGARPLIASEREASIDAQLDQFDAALTRPAGD